MIQEIALGILTVLAGLGAYLSARKMSRGPIYYYGKTLAAGDASAIQATAVEEQLVQSLPADAKAMLARELAMIIAATRMTSGNVTILKSELGNPVTVLLAGQILAKVAELSDLDEGKSTPTRGWKDDIEERLRALEEKSAAEERPAFAEELATPPAEQVH